MRLELIRPLGELIRGQAERVGSSVAFEDAHRAVTYARLAERTERLAGHLRHLGVEPGHSVALMLPNSVDWIEACFAVARADGVVVPISHDAAPDEVAYRLADANCGVVITTDEQAPMIAALPWSEARAAQLIIGDRGNARFDAGYRLDRLLAEPAVVPPRDPRSLEATRFIVYTSGTTGRAKGVKLSERSMLWIVACCWSPIAGLSEKDVLLCPLPLFHSYGLNLCVLGVLATGAREYILERFSVHEVLRLLGSGAFTMMPGVPTMFHYLLNASRANGRPPAGQMRVCISAGAILSGSLNAEFEAHFRVPLLDGYGITETSTMVTMNWPTGERVMGACGLPLPGVAVRLLDPMTGADVQSGDEGEIVIRGPNLMQGYHNKLEETATALRDGWYRTGDLARSDANGLLTITGRLKELIIRGGQNIAPAEVERVLAAHHAVLDCAVVGIAHEHLGEVPVAFVVPREDVDLELGAIIAHCGEHLSAYKVPAAIHIISEIPRTGSGKVMRFRLRDQLRSPLPTRDGAGKRPTGLLRTIAPE